MRNGKIIPATRKKGLALIEIFSKKDSRGVKKIVSFRVKMGKNTGFKEVGGNYWTLLYSDFAAYPEAKIKNLEFHLRLILCPFP